MISNLQNIGKRIDNLKKVILKENPKDLWIIKQIHPLFIQLVDNNISKEQENHLISLLEQILDKYLWRFNSTFEHKTLTSYLLEGLLPEEEKKQTTAVYAGGFKPPTSGHFEVVQQALKENPEIDEFIIFVGAKPRDGVSQTESLLIWEIYNNYLPFKVKIEPTSIPPIRAVYNFAKEHPTREVLWVIGAREGNEEDFKDITSRTSSISKYPNLELRTIVTSGGVSGTAARNAAKVSLDKFSKFVPDQLTDEEKQEVFDLVSGTIQENYVLQDLENQYGIDLDLYDNGKHLTLSRISIPKDKRGQGIGSKVMNQITQYADKENKPIYLTPTKDFGASSVSRLEQFYKQFGFKKKDRSDFSTKETMVRIPLNEADPKKGTGKKPKGSGRRLYTDEDPKDTVGVKFSTRQDIVDTLNKKSFKAKSHARQSQIINLIHQRTRAAYNRAKKPDVKKRLKTALDYITKRKEASKKKTQRLKKQKNENVAPNHKGKAAPFGSGYKKVKEGDTIEKYSAKGKATGKLKQGTVRKRLGIKKGEKIPMSRINKELARLKKMDKDPDKKGAQLGDKNAKYYKALQLAKTLKTTTNVNEAIDSSKFDFSPYIASLTKHMLDNGMKLEPLPQIQLIHDDYENGEDLFGKTAYYAPQTNIVVLFTYGRHPKDILRSYAHELVHVHQNMEDRLTGLGANTDVNQDDHLEQIEREAYETGNIMFRSWTDSITGNKLEESVKALITEKKKKDPFGLNAYAMELARGLEEQESEYKVYLDMDGVLADFDKRFEDIAGMEPKAFEDKYGTKAFWNLIDEENKISFWVGIPEMPGAKALVDAVKDYNFELLTSPSAKKQSYLGKILWVRNHKDLFGGKPRINFKRAKEKHLIKPELSKTDILIDDREDTIARWNTAGGTGIVYKNISQVLNDLGKLGL